MNDVEFDESRYEPIECLVLPDEMYDAFVRSLEENPRFLQRLCETFRSPSPFASETEA